ncbi:hypothetical protein LCGC14_1094150 [marine sediment metagenome]|uniref:Uncharacterized protein n=1 Tax=marine sediment metagenome TaxID=412755 RepID=A0A0F9MFS9_9ZZZZ
MIYVCEHCDTEVIADEKPVLCEEVISYGGQVLLGYVSKEMASDAGEPDMEGQPIMGEQELDICGGQFRILGEI